MITIERTGLKTKADSDSARYELHPHSFRKYFFSNCLAAGIDRGLTEMWMGHVFRLDNAYLRMSDEQLEAEYLKAVDRFTFLDQRNGALKNRMEQLEEENEELKARLDRLEAMSVERLILATKNGRRPSARV